MRFQKRIKIAPGIRINLGKKGGSLSLGARGASVNIGRRGVFQNIGIPGTGISFRNKISSGSSWSRGSSTSNSSEPKSIGVKVSLLSDGTITISDENDLPLSASLEKKVKKEKKDEINALINEHMQLINKEYDACVNQYKLTPPPDIDILGSLDFNIEKPDEPKPYKTNFFTKILFLDNYINNKNQKIWKKYNADLQEWQEIKNQYLSSRKQYLLLIESSERGDVDSMSTLLSSFLDEINWSKETIITYDFSRNDKICLDIDLPEIEDMPTRKAQISKVGFKLHIKQRSEKETKITYYKCINSTIFRVIGEVFASLKNIQEVEISGYTQRINASDGNLNDDYIISVSVTRDDWNKLNFLNIEHIDPCIALEEFNLRRNVDRSYRFKTITPYS